MQLVRIQLVRTCTYAYGSWTYAYGSWTHVTLLHVWALRKTLKGSDYTSHRHPWTLWCDVLVHEITLVVELWPSCWPPCMLCTVWPENLVGIKFGGLALKGCELYWRIKIWGFGNLQSENDVILTARRGRGALVVYVRSCVGRLRWSPSLRYCVRGTTSTKTSRMGVVRSSSDAKERHCRRPRTQEDISCLLAISGRSAACCYFWQISDRGTIVLWVLAARGSSSVATRPRPQHVMTKINIGGI